MTPKDIERAVSAYLRHGKGDEFAGIRQSCKHCPVAKATYDLHVFDVSRAVISYAVLVPGGGCYTERLVPSPRVMQFITLVDEERGTGRSRGVTKARCRELWREAKESTA